MGKSVLVKKEYLDKVLSQESKDGKRNLEPLKSFAIENSFPMTILEDKNVSNRAEVHAHEDDLWFCLEGEVEFIYGGELINPVFKEKNGVVDKREINADGIKNGTTEILKKGDWLYIPAGEPHQHNCKGLARLSIIKIPKK